MDEALVYVIVIVVGATAIGIGGLFALDYSRKLRGIKPPPPYVPRENEIDVFASLSRVSGAFMLALVLVVGYFSPVDGLAVFLIGAFLFMRAGLKLHAKTGVLIRKEVGLALCEWLALLVVLGMLAGFVLFRSTGLVGMGWSLVSLLLGGVACFCLAGADFRASKLWYFTTPLLIALQPATSPPSLFDSPLDRENALEFVESPDALADRGSMTLEMWGSVYRELALDGDVAPDVHRVLSEALKHEHRWGALKGRDAVCIKELAEYSYLQGRDYDEIGAMQFAWLLEGKRGWYKDTVLVEAVQRLREIDLSEDDRLALAIKLGQTPIRSTKEGHLNDVVARLRALDQLGHPEQAEPYAPDARAMVLKEDLNYGTKAYHAVQIMKHFGVPEEFDLDALHVSLSVEARDPLFDSLEIDQVLAFATLKSLERLPEWQPIAESRSSWPYRFWQYRIALIGALIALASIAITIRTPKGSGVSAAA